LKFCFDNGSTKGHKGSIAWTTNHELLEQQMLEESPAIYSAKRQQEDNHENNVAV
jgi:hypothetical protein